MITRKYTPYTPAVKMFPILTDAQKLQLFGVQPSISQGLEQRPCRVTLNDGEIFNNVYIAEANSYIKYWGVWPEDDPGKKALDISKVVDIAPSPNRLPAFLANKLYSAGESSMGGLTFIILFSDNSEQAYEYGGALDFVTLPGNKNFSDIVDVIPNRGSKRENKLKSPDFYWCLYGEESETS